MNKSKFLKVSLNEDGLLKIIFNRPEKKNALSAEMITAITEILTENSSNPKVKVIAFTGTGEYFTSGNDLTNFINPTQTQNEEESTIDDFLQEGKTLFENFVAAFITCSKILVAVINGHSIGIGVTILAHFDVVIASEKATFYCPFVKLGQTPEGCSTFLFPLLMGHSKATELLLLGKKIIAREALERNLVTSVVKHSSLESVWEGIKNICSFPPNTVLNVKSLLRKRMLTLLHQVNKEECNMLVEQWSKDEFLDSVMGFIMKKSKL